MMKQLHHHYDDQGDSQLSTTMSASDEDVASDANSTVSSSAERKSNLLPILKKPSNFDSTAVNEKSKDAWLSLPPPDMKDIQRKLSYRYSNYSSICPLDQNNEGGDDINMIHVDEDKLISTSTSSPSLNPKRVTFDRIHVRVHGQTVGDNPSVTSGVHISLNWDYEDTKPTDVHWYEENRERRRTVGQLLLKAQQRHMVLKMHYNIPNEEMNRAIQDVQSTKQQRAKSNRTYKFVPSLVGILIGKRSSSSLSSSSSKFGGIHGKMNRIQALANVGY